LTKDLLWTLYPYLWHMAEPGSWPSIRQRGLLSTSALLDEYGIDAATRAAIESRRRPSSVPVRRAGLPDAVIRDQRPMSDGALVKCLRDDLTPADWYRMLNERTFFWLSRARLRRLLEARAYRGRPQTILTLETRSLVEAHSDQIELSPINSGSTIFNPVPRGLRTFLPIEEYDFEAWRRKRPVVEAVVELVVRRGVPDVRDHVLCVHDWTGDAMTEVWRRPEVDPSVGP
jgi:hypothetical protein